MLTQRGHHMTTSWPRPRCLSSAIHVHWWLRWRRSCAVLSCLLYEHGIPTCSLFVFLPRALCDVLSWRLAIALDNRAKRASPGQGAMQRPPQGQKLHGWLKMYIGMEGRSHLDSISTDVFLFSVALVNPAFLLVLLLELTRSVVQQLPPRHHRHRPATRNTGTLPHYQTNPSTARSQTSLHQPNTTHFCNHGKASEPIRLPDYCRARSEPARLHPRRPERRPAPRPNPPSTATPSVSGAA